MGCFDDKKQLVDAFDYIKNEYGEKILHSPEKLRTLLMDLAPDFQKQTRIFLNVIHNAEIVKLAQTNKNVSYDLLFRRICDDVGLSESWAHEATLMLFVFLERDAEIEIAMPVFENSESISDNEKSIDTGIVQVKDSAKLTQESINIKELNKFSSMLSDNIVSISGHIACVRQDGSVVAAGDNSKNQCNVGQWEGVSSVHTIYGYTLGHKFDDTVVIVGNPWLTGAPNHNSVSKWKDITKVEVTTDVILGITNSGRVMASGSNFFGQQEVTSWVSIKNIACSSDHCVGLKSDGTVVAVGSNKYGECNTFRWTNVNRIYARYGRTIALTEDGRVMTAGLNDYGQCETYEWRDIIDVSTDSDHTVGLKSDGTVIATGRNFFGECNVERWHNIIDIATYLWVTVGLKSDGTIVTTGDKRYIPAEISQWKDIVAIKCGNTNETIQICGIKSDGTILIAGYDVTMKNVFSWKLFDKPSEIIKRRTELAKTEKAKAETRAIYRSQNACQYCGGSFKGLFTKKCKNCGREKDY